MTDLVSEDLTNKGGAEGQPGMLTPAQITEMESKRAAAAAANPPKEGEGSETTPLEPQVEELLQITEEQLTDLVAKVDRGETLTPEEMELYEKVEKGVNVLPEVQRPPKTYNIAGKQLSEENATKQALEFYGLDATGLPQEALDKLVVNWVKAQNRSAAQVSVVKGQRENAQTRINLERERQRLEALGQDIKRQRERVAREKEVLKVRAEDPITVENISTEEDRIKYLRKMDAQDRLAAVDSSMTQLTQDEQAHQVQMQKLILGEHALTHPEYETTEGFLVTLDKVAKDDPSVSEEDRLKVLEAVELLDLAVEKGQPLESIWALRNKQGNLAVKPVAQSRTSALSGLPSAKDVRQTIALFKERAKGVSAAMGTGAVVLGQRRGPLTAKDIIAVDKKILGDGKGDPFYDREFKNY